MLELRDGDSTNSTSTGESHNIFLGLNFIGHLLPALPLWAMGCLSIMWGLHIFPRFGFIEKLTGSNGGRSSERSDLIIFVVTFCTGFIYAGIHSTLVYTGITTDNARLTMDNIVHTNIGVALMFGATMHWIFSRQHMPRLSINFGIPLVFFTIGAGIGFHQDHMMSGPNGESMEDPIANWIHTMFGISMIMSGALAGIASKWRRWQVIEGTVHVLSATLLTASTTFFVTWTRDNHIGVGNLVTFSVWFAVLHPIAFGLYVHFAKRAEESANWFDANEKEGDIHYSAVDSADLREPLEEDVQNDEGLPTWQEQ